jgi:predicted nucleic acid-binding Zn finger protein
VGVSSDDGSGSTTEGWLEELRQAGRLTPSAVEQIGAIHGERGLTAIEAVSDGRVKQYQDFTVVVGHDDEYIIEEAACTCKDSQYNLDRTDPSQRCWHVLAVEIAEAIDAVDHHEMWYSDVREFL